MSATIHAEYLDLAGDPRAGVITITPNTTDQQLRDPAGNVIYAGPKKVRLVAGEATIVVPGTDDVAFAETDWQYRAVVELAGGPKFQRWFEAPDGSTVELADVAGELAPGDPMTHPVAQADLDALEAALTASTAAAILVRERRLEGVLMWVYGSSFTLATGTACTAGLEFHELLRDRLRMSTTTTLGVASTSIRRVAKLLVGGLGVTDAQWLTTRKGVGIIDSYVNDLAPGAAGGGTLRAYTAKDISGIKNNLRASLAAMSAATITDHSAGTGAGSGTWANSSSNMFRGGNAHYNNTAGGYWEWTGVTFPTAGYIFAGIAALDPSVLAAAAIEVRIDGTLTQTIAAADLQTHQSIDASSSDWFSPGAFRINAAAGSHTVRLTHAGTGSLFVDALYIPAAQSVACPILVIQDALPLTGAYTAPQVATMTANKVDLDIAYAAVLADFPNAIWVPTTLTAALDYAVADGLHPNDRGMLRKADELMLPLLAYIAANRPSNLHAIV